MNPTRRVVSIAVVSVAVMSSNIHMYVCIYM